MGWRRLDSTQVTGHLQAAFDRQGAGTEKLAELALAHLRLQLLGGQFVAVQDDSGHTFIGTPEEATEHMMGMPRTDADRTPPWTVHLISTGSREVETSGRLVPGVRYGAGNNADRRQLGQDRGGALELRPA